MLISVAPQIIDPSQSSVTFAATKVELKLKKAEASSWPKLNVMRLEETPQEESKEEKELQVDDLDVNGVDLSDL